MQPGADPCLRFIVARTWKTPPTVSTFAPTHHRATKVLTVSYIGMRGTGRWGVGATNTGTGSAWFRIHSGLGGDALGATMSPRSNSARCRNRPSSAATAVASSTSTWANMRGSTIASGRNGWFK